MHSVEHNWELGVSMSRLTWDDSGSRYFEAGVDRGVLYVENSAGVPWVGLISVDETSSQADVNSLFLDGYNYANVSTPDRMTLSISAFTYPVEFSECDGSKHVRSGLFFGQQKRSSFGLSYRTMVGNDTTGSPSDYKIHVVYNLTATPPGRSRKTIAESIEASAFSWEAVSKPKMVDRYNPVAVMVIDSRLTHPVTLSAVEDILYGTDSSVARIPTPTEIISLYDIPVQWEVTDLGDGDFKIAGTDDNVRDIGNNMILIDHPDVAIVDDETFTVTY